MFFLKDYNLVFLGQLTMNHTRCELCPNINANNVAVSTS